MSNNRENVQYRVNVEFPKFSKKFNCVDKISLDNISGATVLTIKDHRTTYKINWDKVDYFEMEETHS